MWTTPGTVRASSANSNPQLARDLEFTEWVGMSNLKDWPGSPEVDLLEITSTDTVEVQEQ